jgi:SAM-dependent methyltransferase
MDTYHSHEWAEGGSLERIDEPVWKKRYEYESQLIDAVLENNPKLKKGNVLEIGSGPGSLSQFIQDKHPDINYHLIDKPLAEKAFNDLKYKGTFFVKDLAEQFDTTGLLEKYDLVIMNDFLEHITNPHIILKTVHNLTHKDSVFFISNPNWRMGHPFLYRGTFDFDNFIFMLHFHRFDLEGFYGSFLKTPFKPKLDSEKLLPDENVTDWNHYFVFKHREPVPKQSDYYYDGWNYQPKPQSPSI